MLSFTRSHGDEIILVVCNLSRFSQVVELDLSAHAGTIPVDVFSQNAFPPVRETPYMLMIGPHGYHIFSLRKEREAGRPVDEQDLPELSPASSWERMFTGALREELERSVLPRHLKKCRWFKGWNRTLNRVRIVRTLPVGSPSTVAHLCLLEVNYGEGAPETYLLPLAFSPEETVPALAGEHPSAMVARATVDGRSGFLYDGVHSRGLRDCLFELVERKRKVSAKGLSVAGRRGRTFRLLAEGRKTAENSRVLRAGQEDTIIVYDNTLVLKIYRRLEEGTDPDTEIARRLAEKHDFPHIPPFAGLLEMQDKGSEPMVIGHLQGYVHDTTDAWTHTLDTVGRYFERVLALGREEEAHTGGSTRLVQELAGTFSLEMASLLGRRNAELHLALAAITDDKDFRPQPFSLLYQRSIYQSMRSSVRRTFQLLARKMKDLPDEVRPAARALLRAEKKILLCLKGLLARKFGAMKIRIHGNLDLAQVLFTGKDFVFVDFEGDPSRPLGERRLLRSPLRDAAGILRSLHSAAHTALRLHPSLRPDDIPLLRPWADRWFHLVGKSYLSGYFTAVGKAPFLPVIRSETTTLLRSFVLERAVDDLNRELLSRPDFVSIPLSVIEYILVKGHCGAGGDEEESDE
jgi:maltose alpha-D-glucosyltransferase/alpha-amylase